MQGPGRAYTLLQLARRMLSYCEAQVALSHSSAFPLAEVAASVLASHPDFAPILLGKLYEVSTSTKFNHWPVQSPALNVSFQWIRTGLQSYSCTRSLHPACLAKLYELSTSARNDC